MTYAGVATPDAAVTRTGGTALTPPGFTWPRCRECEGSMEFLAQIRLADTDSGSADSLSIFMCQNDPGLCDEWDPTAGGNRAFVFGPEATETPPVPDDGIALLDETAAVDFEPIETGGSPTTASR